MYKFTCFLSSFLFNQSIRLVLIIEIKKRGITAGTSTTVETKIILCTMPDLLCDIIGWKAVRMHN